MATLDILQIPVLSDNYVYLAHEATSGATAVIDPALDEPVLASLDAKGWTLTHILNTHHHGDHTGGNLALKEATGCTIVGPRAEAPRIPGIDIQVGDGDTYSLGGAEARVYDVPGHTSGHIAYWFAASQALFCGDTLFALGCGRLFEGTPAKEIDELRGKDVPTVPSTLGQERATNPFLRADNEALARAVGLAGADPVKVFAEVRQRKDNF